MSPSSVKKGSASMAWTCTGTPSGQAPNSEAGRQEWKNSAPRAPGRVWASSCAGMTPSENPA